MRLNYQGAPASTLQVLASCHALKRRVLPIRSKMQTANASRRLIQAGKSDATIQGNAEQPMASGSASPSSSSSSSSACDTDSPVSKGKKRKAVSKPPTPPSGNKKPRKERFNWSRDLGQLFLDCVEEVIKDAHNFTEGRKNLTAAGFTLLVSFMLNKRPGLDIDINVVMTRFARCKDGYRSWLILRNLSGTGTDNGDCCVFLTTN